MTAAAPRAFVLGWPIAQSRSPLIHGFWLAEHGLAGSYERLAVPPEEIESFLRALPGGAWAGGNVTVPHKEVAYRIASERDPVAEATGAVNTLWIDGGKLCGANTDAPGFLANLDDRSEGWDTRPGDAVVLGAGGAASAVAWGLQARGFRVRLVNRTLARAEALAARLGGETRAHGWDDVSRLLVDARLLVNTTSLGMTGKDDMTIDLAPLPSDALVTDIVYVPLETPLLAAARARGLATVDGLGMLLHQAVPGFERWFGVRPTVTPALRRRILADLGGIE
ncbi:shikimate dehydrogenase [Pinisolibacter aquiterrae]|uniref:shikimate dehydrogenase n=1 Tax=Pinisolibacter aquiterrae TaxID=2815579 RepID=UPI001C3CA230|nr:shikimate dehydrogenase [Pinisolibacter aquiterrae]MBV5266159.1 shikimate dehydrogenase [Pinisolibacter aquiterrae]MCC8236247.1 shikimate dehydrogenase [Pinisolibacter aquiterrae]